MRFFQLSATSPLALIILGALGLWLGMPNAVASLPPAALLYPAALALLARAPRPGVAFRRGWICGLAGASACLYWIALPVHEVGGLPWLLAAPCAVALGAYVGLYGGIFAAFLNWLSAGPACSPWRRALLAGLVWYLLEWLRGWLFSGFPWLSLSSAFAPWPAFCQGVSVLGMYGLSGLFVGLIVLLLEGLSSPASRKAALAAILGLLLLPVPGFWRMSHLDKSPGKPVTLSLVQGNIDQNIKWKRATQRRTLDRYLDLSRAALDVPEKRPGLIIWPETAMPFDYQSPRLPFPETIRRFVRESGVSLLFGAPGFLERDEEDQIFNRVYLLSPETAEAEIWYEKEHLVPFGEFVPPWLDFPFLRPLLQGVGGFTPGQRTRPLLWQPSSAAEAAGGEDSPPLVLGLLICYESIFPELARQRVADGASLLVNLSNDAWFGRTAAARQHLDLALLRAVEQERWLARGTNTGISAFVDPAGRVLAEGGLFRAESLTHAVTARHGHSLFFHLSPFLPGLALILLGLALFPFWKALRGPQDSENDHATAG